MRTSISLLLACLLLPTPCGVADVTVVVGQPPAAASGPSSLLTGLMAHWSFNEASGIRQDSHTNDQDLSDTTTVPSTTGLLGNALDAEYDTQEYVSRTDSPSLSLGADSSLTIAGFFKLESKPAFPGAIIFKGTAPGVDVEYEVFWDSSDRISFLVGDGTDTGAIDSTETGFTLGTWYFFVCWRNAATKQLNMQINAGTPATSTWATTETQDGTGIVSVGVRHWNPGYAFDGAIDELGIWNRVLTGAEIIAYRNGGAGIAYPF